ncbi:MAG TPA: DUF1697 domain-containing protein [Labilithrix sp.]|nr:DUF1697 domain-containing protein [Labilithrix sp.]
MRTFVALLRAVNVGGNGKLAMSELVALCEKAGFSSPTTYIQSGNVVFESDAREATVKATLEEALAAKLGAPVGVFLRGSADLERVLADNPFKDAPPNRVIVVFFDEPLPEHTLRDVRPPDGERLALHGRELYIHYPNGQGSSKLKLPHVALCTARNINTVTKLAAMAQAREKGAHDRSPAEQARARTRRGTRVAK